MYSQGNQEVPPRTSLESNQYNEYSVLNGQNMTGDSPTRRVLGQFHETEVSCSLLNL